MQAITYEIPKKRDSAYRKPKIPNCGNPISTNQYVLALQVPECNYLCYISVRDCNLEIGKNYTYALSQAFPECQVFQDGGVPSLKTTVTIADKI